MTYLHIIASMVVGLVCLPSLAAKAGTFTVANETALVAYSGSAPDAYFNGANPYVAATSIGTGFDTASLTVAATQQKSGQVDLDLTYLTTFAGSETVNGVLIAAADLFITPASDASMMFGISLGDQAQNGGVAAGLYQVQSYETSFQLWNSRGGFVYAGAFAPSTQYQPNQPGFTDAPIPTVITGGKYLSGATITTTSEAQGWYEWNIAVVLTANQEALLNKGFNVMWGTADCGNGAFNASLPSVPVREPGSLLLLACGAVTLLTLRRLAPSA